MVPLWFAFQQEDNLSCIPRLIKNFSVTFCGQATFNGFNVVNKQSVLTLCTTPPPIKVKQVVNHCCNVDLDGAVNTAMVSK